MSFVIPKNFIELWTKWIEFGSNKGGPKPGPIDNRALKKSLLRKKQGDQDHDDYYTLSKPLFMYFIKLFGGGPAVVTNTYLYGDRTPLMLLAR
jgi:hypothetical protein